MCGLVAAFSTHPEALIDDASLTRARQALVPRGPDQSGQMCVPSFGLAHQRLSIIDPDSGEQPMRSHDGRFLLVYNGEVYNHVALRNELRHQGVKFHSQCDTEVVLHGYALWGRDLFPKLDGMFSIVIIDTKRQEVLFARDRYGIKPLYVTDNFSGVRVAASDLNAIKAYQPHSWIPDPVSIDHLLTLGYIIEPSTYYRGVRQVLPGVVEVHKIGSPHFRQESYWSLNQAMNLPAPTLNESDGVSLLRQAVESQRHADVPVGCFLSGGMDSSIIATLLSQSSHLPVSTYSAGFNDHHYDEAPLARAMASRLGTKHNECYFDESILTELPLLNKIYGSPFADNAALPTFHLASMAKNNVKVLLSGDGADELFFGYRNHRALFVEQSLKNLIPGRVGRNVLGWLSEHYPNHPSMPRFLRGQSTLKSLSLDLANGYCMAMSATSREVLSGLYQPGFLAQIDGGMAEQRFSAIAAGCDHEDPMKVMQFLDFKTYLPGSVLKKVDRATMAAGIESRVPFLSNRLVDAVLPQESKNNLGWRTHKTQLRTWSRDLLPENNRARAKKSFTSPLDSWFRGLQYPQLCRMILPDKFLDSNIFDVDALHRLVKQHHQGNADHGATLWAIAALSCDLQD